MGGVEVGAVGPDEARAHDVGEEIADGPARLGVRLADDEIGLALLRALGDEKFHRGWDGGERNKGTAWTHDGLLRLRTRRARRR